MTEQKKPFDKMSNAEKMKQLEENEKVSGELAEMVLEEYELKDDCLYPITIFDEKEDGNLDSMNLEWDSVEIYYKIRPKADREKYRKQKLKNLIKCFPELQQSANQRS